MPVTITESHAAAVEEASMMRWKVRYDLFRLLGEQLEVKEDGMT